MPRGRPFYADFQRESEKLIEEPWDFLEGQKPNSRRKTPHFSWFTVKYNCGSFSFLTF